MENSSSNWPNLAGARQHLAGRRFHHQIVETC
jgi:hypothetical protein